MIKINIFYIKPNENTSTIHRGTKLQICIHIREGARCSSVVRVLLMVRWVVGSILHGGPTELFLVSTIAPQLV